MIASLHRDRVNLDLKTVDICFLVALHARADQSGLTCFEEDVLLDVFEQVCDAVEADAENVAKRATHAIQRLRDQRLLARVDGAGVIRAGEYALTQLALGIVRFFQADEALTRESLTLLTKTLLASLADVKATARQSTTSDEWREGVIGPLRVTVGDLVGGIERRQRGLDLQQEAVQQRISELLQEDWFGAVDQCQLLLDETTTTLAELNTVRRFYLVAAHTPPIRLLRESAHRAVRPPVRQPRRDREGEIEDVMPEADIVTLEDRVRQSLANGSITLADVLSDVLPEVPPTHRYVSVGRVAWQVANETRPRSPRERDWASTVDEIEVENWHLSNGQTPHSDDASGGSP